jgi:hypothetical protein
MTTPKPLRIWLLPTDAPFATAVIDPDAERWLRERTGVIPEAYVREEVPLSPEALAALEAGLKSARTEPLAVLDLAEYADEDTLEAGISDSEFVRVAVPQLEAEVDRLQARNRKLVEAIRSYLQAEAHTGGYASSAALRAAIKENADGE